jgi:glycogen phosphorylase
VREYVEDWYAPAARAAARISVDGYGPARSLAAFRARLNAAWPRVQITGVDASGLPDTPEVGAPMTVRAAVELAGLDPSDVLVQAVVGRVGDTDDLVDTVTAAMEHVGVADGTGERFETVVKLPHAGLTGYTVRVLPAHPLLASSAELAKIVLPG